MSKRVENLAPEGWDRGTSCLHILRSLYGVDWEERVKVSSRGLIISLHQSLFKLVEWNGVRIMITFAWN